MSVVAEQSYKGTVASEGLVLGDLFVVSRSQTSARRVGNPDEEAQALKTSLALAGEQLASLSEAQSEMAAEILEFQSMLLEDDDLLSPVYSQINSGTSAHLAWADHLDLEIADYKSADDEYLSARSDDLLDLKTRVIDILTGKQDHFAKGVESGAIILLDDLTPSQFLDLDWKNLAGAATRAGSRTSHVSILARAYGVPLVVGLSVEIQKLCVGTPALLDAEKGLLVLNPNAATLNDAHERTLLRHHQRQLNSRMLALPAVMKSGEVVKCMINVDEPAYLDELEVDHCDGIGLTRTEFLFRDGKIPDEQAQYLVYRKILEWANGRPVTIRTLDAGGDKPIEGVTMERETNPFLGVRGIRLSLRHPAFFRVQLRALARAAVHGNLKVMVPMVTQAQEMQQFRNLMKSVILELENEAIDHAEPALGMMVEVPAAAIVPEAFDADFFSIGTNDLIQYVTASARDNPALGELADAHHPAVLKLIEGVVKSGENRNIEISVCGDMASDTQFVAILVGLGVRTFSIAPARLGEIKHAISHV